MRRVVSLVVGFLTVAIANTACLIVPGNTSQVNLVSSTTVNGWQYDFYRNSAYPCSVSGEQTFVVGTKWARRPLLHRHFGCGCTVAVSDTSILLGLPGLTRRKSSETRRPRSRQRSPPPGSRPTSRGIQPDSDAGRFLLQPRHLQRYRPDRHKQLEYEHRWNGESHQRTPSHQSSRCLHRSQIPDIEILPSRRKCRISWRVLRRLV